MNSAERVRQVRAALGLSPGEFAAYLSVGTAIVQGWEADQRPVPAAVLRDVDALEEIGPEIRDLLPLEDFGAQD